MECGPGRGKRGRQEPGEVLLPLLTVDITGTFPNHSPKVSPVHIVLLMACDPVGLNALSVDLAFFLEFEGKLTHTNLCKVLVTVAIISYREGLHTLTPCKVPE